MKITLHQGLDQASQHNYVGTNATEIKRKKGKESE